MAGGLGSKASVEERLHQAALGRVGVDRRLIRWILESPDAAAGVLSFARASRDDHRLDLEPVLIDLFRHFQSTEALDFYIDAIRRAPEEVGDDLIQALLPFGEKAVGPLLQLYEELGEEQGSDIAFLLAGLRVRDPRALELLLDRLEYDTRDGAFCLGLYGDPAARLALEKLLAEISEDDAGLRREITYAMEQMEAPEPHYLPEPFDIFGEYPEVGLPAFSLLPEAERRELLKSDDPEVRGGAWESLAGSAEHDVPLRNAMLAGLNDSSRPVEERGGAAVGLYEVAEQDEVRRGIEDLYELGGHARAKALEAMWRSLWEPFAKYFPPNLDDTDPKILREALRGAGYFQLTRYAERIAGFFDREEPYDDLREDALFAYALVMPGETTRGRARGMLRKIAMLASLTDHETELVEFALDERLRLHGLDPVFSADQEEEQTAQPAEPPASEKPGRNDPCPCGSGKKYKKCCGR